MTQTVRAVLAKLTTENPDTRKMFAAVIDESNVGVEDLTTEELLLPMKISGGRVCLEINDRTLESNCQVRWVESDEFEAIEGVDATPYGVYPKFVENLAGLDEVSISPMLLEGTHFSSDRVEQ